MSSPKAAMRAKKPSSYPEKMMSSAIDHIAIVLAKRRMKVRRAGIGFVVGPVTVTGMAEHHQE
jgi:hypothetical protein